MSRFVPFRCIFGPFGFSYGFSVVPRRLPDTMVFDWKSDGFPYCSLIFKTVSMISIHSHMLGLVFRVPTCFLFVISCVPSVFRWFHDGFPILWFSIVIILFMIFIDFQSFPYILMWWVWLFVSPSAPFRCSLVPCAFPVFFWWFPGGFPILWFSIGNPMVF